MVLADGLGSNIYAGLAAKIAVKTLTDAFQRMTLPAISNPFKFLGEHILQVHNVIQHYVLDNEIHDLPRTTIVVAIVQHDRLYCAHVGDSRLYHFRDGSLLYRTEDHSKVQLMYRKGEIEEEQTLTHPERNKIYNCIGGNILPRVDFSRKRTLLNGDTILLCSDGLWSMLNDRELCSSIQQENVIKALPKLLDLAEARCGNTGDNMSVVALNWGGHSSSDYSVSTLTMPLGHTTTILSPTPQNNGGLDSRDTLKLSEEEIEKSIAEIQAAIHKIPRQA